MTTGPEQPDQPQQAGAQPPPPPPPPPYPGQQQGYGYPYPGPYGVSPQAPYGIHPATGLPYSDRSKLVAGLLQILIPLGIGRFYIGDTRIGVWQLVVTIVTCGIGALWPFVDGIIILASDSKDVNGLPLRS